MNNRNKFHLVGLLFFSAIFLGCASTQKAPELWTLCDSCAQPESVYLDPISKNLFVSNVDGDPITKDKKGSVQKVSPSGKMIDANWISGLNSPKGLRSAGDLLFVADIDELVVIRISSGKIIKRVAFKGARLLNDVVVSTSGTVYVSDTLGSAIYEWDQKSAPKIFLKSPELESPNGLLFEGSTLYIAAWGLAADDWSTKTPGRLLALDLKTKKILPLSKPLGNLDGIERMNGGDFLISDWTGGKVYRVNSEGRATLLLSGFKGAADLGYDPVSGVVFLPRMGENLISAFQL